MKIIIKSSKDQNGNQNSDDTELKNHVEVTNGCVELDSGGEFSSS